MRTLAGLVALLAPPASLFACSQTYHPEYHPETSYSFVQNVSYGTVAAPDRCKLGRTGDCWRACFDRSDGAACYLLGVMFETGNGVPRSHEKAARMAALASKLRYEPAVIDVDMAAPYLDLWGRDVHEPALPSAHASGEVSAPGGVVIYGSLNGDVYLGHQTILP